MNSQKLNTDFWGNSGNTDSNTNSEPWFKVPASYTHSNEQWGEVKTTSDSVSNSNYIQLDNTSTESSSNSSVISNLWGEIPACSSSSGPSAFQTHQAEYLKLADEAYLETVQTPPASEAYPPSQYKRTLVDPRFCAMDEEMIMTIKLEKYAVYLEDLVEKLTLGAANIAEVTHILSQPAIPKFEDKDLPLTRRPSNKKLKDKKDGVSYFLQGKWPIDDRPPPIPSQKIALQLLQSSVMTILTHVGFEDCMGSAASALTEVADEYFTKFLSTLRDKTDAYFTPSMGIGFVDPVEATYQEMGIGSIPVVVDFYQAMVLGKRDKVNKKITELYHKLKSLHSTCMLLSNPKRFNYESNVVHIGSMNSPGPSNSLKDMTDEYRDIPELHLSTQRGGDTLNAVLAPGLQLLETMESEQNAVSKLTIGQNKRTDRKEK